MTAPINPGTEIDFFDSGNEEAQGRFHNLYAAEFWAKINGYSIGNTCAHEPIALLRGDYDWIAKWKNLTDEERKDVDGVVVGWSIPDTYKIFIFTEAAQSDTLERSVATEAK